MMTMATPLSAVRTTLVLSFFEFCEGSVLGRVEVAVVVVLLLWLFEYSVDIRSELIHFLGW